MFDKMKKIFRTLIVVAATFAVVAAPTLQAFSFAEQFSPNDNTCGCLCCKSELEESTCPVKSEMSQNGCSCSVKQQHPFNSKPIESSAPNLQSKDVTDQISERIEIVAAISVKSFNQVPFKIPLNNYPPLYILNSSFLI